MKKKQLPDWLYNLLPFFYVGVGLLTMIVLQNIMAIFSGLTLLSAGGMVWMLRYRYRRAFGQLQGQDGAQDFSDDNAPFGAPVRITWRKAYETGHPVIDAQHKRLFGLGNALINAVLSKQSQADVEWLIDELIDHINQHFRTEQSEPTRTNHPRVTVLQEIHQSLLAKAADIRERFHSNPLLSGDLLSFIARGVIVDHITSEVIELGVEAH